MIFIIEFAILGLVTKGIFSLVGAERIEKIANKLF